MAIRRAQRAARVAGIIGSPAYPADPEELKTRALEAFERSFYPAGVARQMVAAASHGNHKPALSTLDVPALVIRGRADPLVPVEGGIDTHEALRGSRLMVIDGMGHDLPRQVWPQVVAGIAELTSRAR
jgi:pimeloyl-ACP methyl ester carboxylesterase